MQGLQLDDLAKETMEPGTRVEVRSRFDGRWSRGFEIAAETTDGYLVRRLSDGAELPSPFATDEIRPERKQKQGLWWD